ncbi:MAG: glycerol kinase [Planctomycetota bacterium]|nr:MAG: glycerol kinase [Planctomycetota bacterium]REJ90063.1 MAG: glycerol kinase [Planctomycetota bacterium]
MSYLLALDQGTTSSRAIVFDREAQVVSVAQREFEQIFPQPGWVEHDPEAIWRSQRDVAREALAAADLAATDIAAIGIANQRETTVVWDRATGEPLHNAIVWQDRRTAPLCERLRDEGRAALVRERTGLVLDAYFSATKVAWLLDNVPGARERAEAGQLVFGTVDSYLVWKLTGGSHHVTDPSNAARTLLFDIRQGRWSDELLELFDIPRAMLPDVVASSGQFAITVSDLFGAAVPIAGIAGDQQAALFGQLCHRAGLAKNTYGTGCFMLLNTGTQPVESQNQLLTTTAWQLGDETTYALEGSVFVGGAVVQWLRDGLGMFQSAADIEPLAASVADTDGVYFVPAFAGLGAPHWDPHARGTLVGLTRGTTAAHIARAALEGIAFQVADVLDAMQEDAARAIGDLQIDELRVDGGAAANDLLLQFQADILGVPVVRPRVTETTALGAALLAGLGVGYWSDVAELADHWQLERRFEPSISRDVAAARREGWNDALQRARHGTPH